MQGSQWVNERDLSNHRVAWGSTVLHTVPSEQALCPRRRVGAPHERTHGEQWISVQMVPAVLMPRKVGAPPRGLIEEHDSESTDTFRPVRSSTGLLKQWVRDVPPKQVIVLQVLNLRVERWHVRAWCAGAGPRRRVSCCCSEARGSTVPSGGWAPRRARRKARGLG